MNKIYRVIDANINRISEGLRVLEDLARFHYNALDITEEIKNIRHQIRKNVNHLYQDFISQRDTCNDIGLTISQKNRLDDKQNFKALIMGNFKRIQEGLRVVEESLKVSGHYDLSKSYEQCRYNVYTIEKKYMSICTKHLKKIA